MANENKPLPPGYKGETAEDLKLLAHKERVRRAKASMAVDPLVHRAKKCELDECRLSAKEDGYCSAKHFETDVLKLEREIQSICRKEGREWLVRDDPKLQKPLSKRQSAITSK